MAKFKRSVSKKLFKDLNENTEGNLGGEGGLLHPILRRVSKDNTLNLELRKNEVHVYHRGGVLVKISERDDGSYKLELSEDYFNDYPYGQNELKELNGKILSKNTDVEECLSNFPYIKDAMDLHFEKKSKRYEREYAQQVIRDNNYSLDNKVNNSDFYILDLEPTFDNKGEKDSIKNKPDLLGIKWPSSERKETDNKDLVFIEMKFQEGSLRSGKDTSGIKEHYQGILKIMKDEVLLKDIREDLVEIFKQKRELGILSCNKDIKSISNNIEYILIFVNHTPKSKVLWEELQHLKKMHEENSPDNLSIKVACSNFMGSALQLESIYELSDFQDIFSKQIKN